VLSGKPLGVFIRSILGLDSNSAKNAFSSFLGKGPLSAVQITFINHLIEHFTRDGQIEPDLLFEQPFTKVEYQKYFRSMQSVLLKLLKIPMGQRCWDKSTNIQF
jgi:type I site-specific restriction endonuclease